MATRSLALSTCMSHFRVSQTETVISCQKNQAIPLVIHSEVMSSYPEDGDWTRHLPRIHATASSSQMQDLYGSDSQYCCLSHKPWSHGMQMSHFIMLFQHVYNNLGCILPTTLRTGSKSTHGDHDFTLLPAQQYCWLRDLHPKKRIKVPSANARCKGNKNFTVGMWPRQSGKVSAGALSWTISPLRHICTDPSSHHFHVTSGYAAWHGPCMWFMTLMWFTTLML